MECLVLSGGGEKGISFLGVIKYIETIISINSLKTIIGTSAGAIISALISIGYTSTEIIYILSRVNIPEIIPVEKMDLDSFLVDFGFLKHDKLRKIINILLDKKTEIESITFLQHWQKYGIHLIISGSDIEQLQSTYFDYNNSPNMPIAEAVVISCSIPFLFSPIRYNDQLFLDGAIFDNYPIKHAEKFHSEDRILGVLINFMRDSNKITSFETFFNNMLNALFVRLQKGNQITKNTIVLDFGSELNTLDIDSKVKYLIDTGYVKAKEFIKSNPHFFHKEIILNTIKYEDIEYNG